MNHSQHTELFRNVASLHKDILHTPDSPHFARIIITRDPFMDSRAQIKEFLEGAGYRIKSPMMIISSYTVDYGDQGGDDLNKLLTSRMIVLMDCRPGDYDSEETAYTETERIGEECLAYLNDYFENNPQEGVFSWNHAGSEKLSGITERNLCGTGFTVSIVSQNNPNLSYNPAKFS